MSMTVVLFLCAESSCSVRLGLIKSLKININNKKSSSVSTLCLSMQRHVCVFTQLMVHYSRETEAVRHCKSQTLHLKHIQLPTAAHLPTWSKMRKRLLHGFGFSEVWFLFLDSVWNDVRKHPRTYGTWFRTEVISSCREKSWLQDDSCSKQSVCTWTSLHRHLPHIS